MIMAKHEKWYVNAPGAESVGFDSEAVAKAVAKQVKGASVSRGEARPKGRHRHADGSVPDSSRCGRD